jgi:hypothetical protein
MNLKNTFKAFVLFATFIFCLTSLPAQVNFERVGGYSNMLYHPYDVKIKLIPLLITNIKKQLTNFKRSKLNPHYKYKIKFLKLNFLNMSPHLLT